MVNVDIMLSRALTQAEFDAKLISSSKVLEDLDNVSFMKLLEIEAGAEVNVGEEFTTEEQSKVAKISIDNVIVEVLASEPGSPVEGDIYYDDVEFNYKRYNGTAWETVKFVVEVV